MDRYRLVEILGDKRLFNSFLLKEFLLGNELCDCYDWFIFVEDIGSALRVPIYQMIETGTNRVKVTEILCDKSQPLPDMTFFINDSDNPGIMEKQIVFVKRFQEKRKNHNGT